MSDSVRRVVVIGGGYTGLVAALRLADRGAAVTVLERGSSLGGLAGDFTIEGAPLEKAYHHLFRTDKEIIALADDLGIGGKLQWHVSKQALYYGGRMYPFAGPLDLLRFSPLSFINRIRAGVVVLLLQWRTNWGPLKSVTAYDWMRRAAGEQVTKVIWEPLLRGKFHRYFDKVSMGWLWARVHIRANSKEKGERTEKLGYFDGGFEVFTTALVQALERRNVEIRTAVEVRSIEDDRSAVRIGLADGETLEADACIATVPSGAFARLLPKRDGLESYIAQLSSIDYLGARLLVFSSEQDLSPAYWHNINDVDLPFLVLINHTKLVGKRAYNGKNVYYIATYLPPEDELFTCSDDELEDRWFVALKQIFPAFDRTQVREKHFFRFGAAQHIVDTAYESKIPDHRTPLRNVYLSNFSQIFPEDRGTNFAVRDGERIAQMVLADLAGTTVASRASVSSTATS